MKKTGIFFLLILLVFLALALRNSNSALFTEREIAEKKVQQVHNSKWCDQDPNLDFVTVCPTKKELIQICESIPPDLMSGWLLDVPKYYYRSTCFQDIVDMTGDESLCSFVIQHKSLFRDSWTSESRCLENAQFLKTKFPEQFTDPLPQEYEVRTYKHIFHDSYIEGKVLLNGTVGGDYDLTVSVCPPRVYGEGDGVTACLDVYNTKLNLSSNQKKKIVSYMIPRDNFQKIVGNVQYDKSNFDFMVWFRLVEPR